MRHIRTARRQGKRDPAIGEVYRVRSGMPADDLESNVWAQQWPLVPFSTIRSTAHTMLYGVPACGITLYKLYISILHCFLLPLYKLS